MLEIILIFIIFFILEFIVIYSNMVDCSCIRNIEYKNVKLHYFLFNAGNFLLFSEYVFLSKIITFILIIYK